MSGTLATTGDGGSTASSQGRSNSRGETNSQWSESSGGFGQNGGWTSSAGGSSGTKGSLRTKFTSDGAGVTGDATSKSSGDSTNEGLTATWANVGDGYLFTTVATEGDARNENGAQAGEQETTTTTRSGDEDSVSIGERKVTSAKNGDTGVDTVEWYTQTESNLREVDNPIPFTDSFLVTVTTSRNESEGRASETVTHSESMSEATASSYSSSRSTNRTDEQEFRVVPYGDVTKRTTADDWDHSLSNADYSARHYNGPQGATGGTFSRNSSSTTANGSTSEYFASERYDDPLIAADHTHHNFTDSLSSQTDSSSDTGSYYDSEQGLIESGNRRRITSSLVSDSLSGFYEASNAPHTSWSERHELNRAEFATEVTTDYGADGSETTSVNWGTDYRADSTERVGVLSEHEHAGGDSFHRSTKNRDGSGSVSGRQFSWPLPYTVSYHTRFNGTAPQTERSAGGVESEGKPREGGEGVTEAPSDEGLLSSLWDGVMNARQVISGAAYGAAEDAVSFGAGVYDAVRHPWQTAQAAKSAAYSVLTTNPWTTVQNVKEAVGESYGEKIDQGIAAWNDGRYFDVGRAGGGLVLEVAIESLPPARATKFLPGGKGFPRGGPKVDVEAPSRLGTTVVNKIGDLTGAERAALKNIFDGGPRAQLPLKTRQALADYFSGVAKKNPAGSAQSAFNQARADYLLGRGSNPGRSVNDFAERMGIPKFKRE